MIGQIQTFFLCLVARADTDRVLQDQQDHEGNETGPGQRGTDGPQLRNELCRGIEISDLVGYIVVYASTAERRIDEYAGTEGTDDTAYAVHAERIQRIVILQFGLEHRYREEADYCCRCTDDHRTAHAYKTRCRRNGHQTGNDTGTDTQQAWLAL